MAFGNSSFGPSGSAGASVATTSAFLKGNGAGGAVASRVTEPTADTQVITGSVGALTINTKAGTSDFQLTDATGFDATHRLWLGSTSGDVQISNDTYHGGAIHILSGGNHYEMISSGAGHQIARDQYINWTPLRGTAQTSGIKSGITGADGTLRPTSMSTFYGGQLSLSSGAVIKNAGDTICAFPTLYSVTTNVVQVTTSFAHSLAVGDVVALTDFVDTTLNGSRTVTVIPSVTQFKFALTHADIGATSDSSGMVTRIAAVTASRQCTSNIVTITMGGQHNLGSDGWVTISNMGDANYNGDFKITVTGQTTFTYLLNHANEGLTADTAGIVTINPILQLGGGTASDAVLIAAEGLFCAPQGSSFLIDFTSLPTLGIGPAADGKSLIILSGDAVASIDTDGAANGGNFLIGAGDAARRNSGNGDGGSIIFETGSKIGSGADGVFAIVHKASGKQVQIYNDGTDCYLEAKSGDLFLRNAQGNQRINFMGYPTVGASSAYYWTNGTPYGTQVVGVEFSSDHVIQISDASSGNGDLRVKAGVLTTGTMTKVSASHAIVRSTTHQFAWTNAMIAALGASLTGDITVCTLPAGTRVKNIYMVLTGTATGPTTLTYAVGRTGASYIDYIVASDAKAAANTVYGDTSGERGTNLTGYDLPSYTATVDIKMHCIATVATLDQTLSSTGVIYIETEMIL